MGNTQCCEETKQVKYFKKLDKGKKQQPKKIHLAQQNAQNSLNDGNQNEKLQSKLNPAQFQKKEYYFEEDSIKIPEISPKIVQYLQRERPFDSTFKQNQDSITHVQYGNDFYEGTIDKTSQRPFPDGVGKMYKEDGSLHVGEFKKGKAEGIGAFIFPDGSYYKGNFKNNNAEDEHGYFYSQRLWYRGGVKENVLNGEGEQKAENYTFKGNYLNGKKTEGTYKWFDNQFEYQYTGKFNDEEEFDGKGKLIEPKGIYKGNFFKGQKHGKGVYEFRNGIRYEGEYNRGVKEGQGILFKKEKKIVYQGSFKNDLPDGEGYGYQHGRRDEKITNWIEGIDVRLMKQR